MIILIVIIIIIIMIIIHHESETFMFWCFCWLQMIKIFGHVAGVEVYGF